MVTFETVSWPQRAAGAGLLLLPSVKEPPWVFWILPVPSFLSGSRGEHLRAQQPQRHCKSSCLFRFLSQEKFCVLISSGDSLYWLFQGDSLFISVQRV